MSLHYKVVKQTFGFDKEKTPMYVVKAVPGEMLPFSKVRQQVAQVCGIHRCTVNSVIEGLIDVLVNNIDMGHSVQLGEFGILRPGLRAKAQDAEKTANAHTIYRRKVNFVPGKLLKDVLRKTAIARMEIPELDYTRSNNFAGDEPIGL